MFKNLEKQTKHNRSHHDVRVCGERTHGFVVKGRCNHLSKQKPIMYFAVFCFGVRSKQNMNYHQLNERKKKKKP